MTKTLRRQSFEKHQRLIIVTVGLADPDIPQNRENIRNALQKQIHAQLYGRAAIFHLRGAIDYQALSLGHRTMMALLHRSLQKKPAEEWSEEDKALMETYGKQADFVDFCEGFHVGTTRIILRSLINRALSCVPGKEMCLWLKSE